MKVACLFIVSYRTTKAHSMENYRWHSHQNHGDDNNNNDVNYNNNDHIIVSEHVIMVRNSKLSETSYNCNEIVEEPIYYEMTLNDYKEHIVNENNGILDFEKMNIMEYDEDISVN